MPHLLMWFNNVATAKTHLECNHNNTLTNWKGIKENQDIIEQTADKTKAVEHMNKRWTSQLGEVHNRPNGLFHMFDKTDTKKTSN